LSQKIIAIHQPNYLPWAGYFLKMAACDVFVFHDNVQITKAGPTRRVKIASRNTPDKTQWLTVPLKQHSDFALIKDLEISWEVDWTRKHLNQIKDTYIKSPYFDLYFPMISNWFQETKRFNSLSEMNIYFIKQILHQLDIVRDIICSSDLPVSGKAASYNLAIIKHLKGNQYLSGAGGDKYQDEQLFTENQIKLKKLDSKTELEEIFSGFDCHINLSIIELLMKVDTNIVKLGFSKINI
jgi:WbqC-like protein family